MLPSAKRARGDAVRATDVRAALRGLRVDAMPVGLQLIGRMFGEADLLRIGHIYERSTSVS